jgi:hypothetical protein
MTLLSIGFVAGVISMAILFNNIHTAAITKMENRINETEKKIVETLRNAFTSSKN